ncbi:MAG: putative ABC exporter domain-containing protein, partial [Oscillospiraceae bacterium]|nr:putative ABC exporter domain-containing protein [Oscillospiraceae bacterium]
MTALTFIVRRSIKNSLKELRHKPGKLVLYGLVLAVIVLVIFVSFITRSHVETPAPLFYFTGILFAFVTLFTVSSVLKGLSGGNAIFEMNDVNFLFVSPVSSRQVLIYGLSRMAKTAFFAGFFILFQASSLANFGIDYGGVLLTFAGFMLSVLTTLTASLLIYNVTNGNPRRKLIVRCVTGAMFLPCVIFAIVRFTASGNVITALEEVIASPYLRYIPVAGWTATGITAFLNGATASGLFCFGLNLITAVGMVAFILLSNPDYYEDTLVATETAFEKKRAIAEGNIGAATASGKPVKLKRTGIAGAGASTLFSKHMRESFRQNRFGFLGLSSVLVTLGAIVLNMFIREPSILLQILMWSQIFMISMGR